MGRKIPAKKHRGVKDPLVQQAKRLQSLKTKINAPPKDPDEQPVPRSLTRLFAFQERANPDKKSNNKKHVKRPIHARGEKASGAGDNPVSRMRRGAGEDARAFALRITGAARALRAPAARLHYPEDMEAEDVKGERMAALRERRARKQQRRAAAAAAAAPAPAPAPRLTKTQRRALKNKEKKLKAMEARTEKQEVVYERVPFGDVCHAPPALPPRRPARALAAAGGGGGAPAPRPGRRDLLLAPLLAPAAPRPPRAPRAARQPPAPPAAEAARRERAREAAVAAYRADKAEKLKAKLALRGKRT